MILTDAQEKAFVYIIYPVDLTVKVIWVEIEVTHFWCQRLCGEGSLDIFRGTEGKEDLGIFSC